MQTPRILKLYTEELELGLEAALADPAEMKPSLGFDSLYGILRYHVGLCDDKGRKNKALGKMLRPSLLMFVTDQLTGKTGNALPAAIALELVHNFSLIHDDIQDGDELRRGRPTVWKLIGIPQAINAGDLMYSIAMRSALEAGSDVAQSIVESASLMIEGQGLDIDFEHRWVDVNSYMNMIDKKTGALLRCSFITGGIIAHADDNTVEALDLIGKELGRAFQIKDDLLGVWGDGEVTGKPSGSDIRRKKKSFPVLLAMQRTDDKGKMLLERVYGQGGTSDSDVASVISLMAGLEVRESAEEEVEKHLGNAGEALDLLPFSGQGRKMMEELMLYLARREK
jgi:geranylgeranyl diphosphate synthase type I